YARSHACADGRVHAQRRALVVADRAADQSAGALKTTGHSKGHHMSVAIETIQKPTVARQDAFDWQDPLDLEGELTEDERMARDTARSYAQDKLFPRALKAFREESFDYAIAREMGALGLLAATLPEQYGGSGFGPVAYGLIAREIERADSGYRSFM